MLYEVITNNLCAENLGDLHNFGSCFRRTVDLHEHQLPLYKALECQINDLQRVDEVVEP